MLVFDRCVTGFVSFILKAVQGRFVIPDFFTFAEETQKLFIKCKQLSSVKVCIDQFALSYVFIIKDTTLCT